MSYKTKLHLFLIRVVRLLPLVMLWGNKLLPWPCNRDSWSMLYVGMKFYRENKWSKKIKDRDLFVLHCGWICVKYKHVRSISLNHHICIICPCLFFKNTFYYFFLPFSMRRKMVLWRGFLTGWVLCFLKMISLIEKIRLHKSLPYSIFVEVS